jgi:ketosteroid isomerase-like protein
MKKLVVLCFLSFSFFGFAQNEIEEIQNVIDQEVWKPFKNAFETLDGEALNATYADEVLRVTPNGIDTKNSFKAKNLERFNQNRKDGLSISLDFWFDSRHTNQATSYEVGFYRIGFTDSNSKTSYSYGQFHIVIKSIDGHWKITQDWDTAQINGKIISKEDFIKKAPLIF